MGGTYNQWIAYQDVTLSQYSLPCERFTSKHDLTIVIGHLLALIIVGPYVGLVGALLLA